VGKPFFYFTFFSYLILIYVVRNSGFDTDIEVYSQSMGYDVYNSYYLREAIFWMSQRFIFKVVGDPVYVFYITDIFLLLVLFLAYKRIGVPRYAYFSILLFVPFFLGFQNIYRQFSAMVFVVYAISFVGRSFLNSLIFFLVSILCHNASAIFFQLLFLDKKHVYFRTVSIVGYLLIPFILYFSAGYKSNDATGLSLEIVYVAILFLLFLIYIIFLDFKIKKIDEYVFIVLNCFYVCSLSVYFLSSASSERLSLFALFIIYPYLCILLERVRPLKSYVRVLFVLATSLPIFIFSSSSRYITVSGVL
jgi:hypothetical protein